MKRLLIFLMTLGLALLSLTTHGTAAASGVTSTARAEAIANAAISSREVSAAIDRMDSSRLATQRQKLTKARAFTQFLKAVDRSGRYVDFYSATLTDSEISALAAKVKGHHFELRNDPDTGRPILRLMPGDGAPYLDASFKVDDPQATRFYNAVAPSAVYGYACWQAAAAALAWAVGAGLLCWPLGGAALVCSIGASVLFPINWNSACR